MLSNHLRREWCLKKKGQLEEEMVKEKGLTSKGKMFLHSHEFRSLPVEHRKQTAISVITCSKRKEESTFQKVPKKLHAT